MNRDVYDRDRADMNRLATARADDELQALADAELDFMNDAIPNIPNVNGHGDGGDDWPDYVIPADWWTERPVLRSVHAWATARLVAPEILLANVFAELSMRIPTAVVLPPTVGGPAALNFGAVVVGATGVGKSSGGRGLLYSATGHRPTGTDWPLGTGEGIADFLLSDPDDDGNRTPHGQPVLIHADEGRTLEELIERSASTLVSTLCSAVHGAALGQGNATRKLRRRVPALDYRIAVVLNIQPIYLRGILADVDGGLPQRFLFVSATGHHLNDTMRGDPAEPLTLPDVPVAMFTARTGTRPTVAVPDAIRATIRRDHVERVRAEDRGEPVAGGSHRNLLRLRVAAFLAVADGRGAVTGDDWDLALPAVVASDATIHRGELLRAELARQAARAETERVVRHGIAVDNAVETNRVERVARKATGWVRDTPGQTRLDIRERLSRVSRPLLDDALELAIARGWIIERAEPSHTGDDRRGLYPGAVIP